MPGDTSQGTKLNVAFLASGKGTNLQAIIDASEKREIDALVKVVISDNRESIALKRAENHGIEPLYIDSSRYSSRESFDRAIVDCIKERQIDCVALGGFMRLLTPFFVKKYEGRIMNIHPSLLPAFPGANGVKDALEYGVKVSGCTVHFVDEGLDTGPIIMQEAVPVYDDDSEESLHQRIHKVEYKLYPRAIHLFARGKIRIRGRRCFIYEE